MGRCIICGEKEATVPDRYSGSRRKQVCSECHTERLRTDLRNILGIWKRDRSKKL